MMNQMNVQDDNSWRTPTFRQNMVSKLDEANQKSGIFGRSGIELENLAFSKAKSRDEYLQNIAKLIIFIKESSSKKQSGQPDPVNALRAMTPGAGNQMVNVPQQGGPQNAATNFMQTLNQNRPTLQNRMPGMQPAMMNQMVNTIGAMQRGSMHAAPMTQVNMSVGNQMNITVNPSTAASMPGPGPMMNTNSMINSVSVPNQMSMSNQMSNNMNAPMLGSMGNVMSNQMSGGQMPQGMVGGMSHNQMNLHMAQRKMVPDVMMIPGQANVPYLQSRGVVPSQFIRQSTPLSQQSMQMHQVSSMIPSPALVSAPSPTQLPMNSGLVSVMRQAGPSMVPSPSSGVTLNTPGGQSQPTPSPLGNEEQAYRDKVKELSRYIEPLRKMISRLGPGDHEKVSKMKKLLEILTTPGQRITMDTLLKCEAVLEKMDMAEMKEQHPLIEAISSAIQSPNLNHTFQRTFEPVMATLNGKPLKTLPKPLKRKQVQENISDIPEVLQGEVARLDQRFKVSLDQVQQNSSKCVYLLCWLDDRHLPCIPPVQITIPEDYPNSSPKCNMSNYEYGATKFLQMIQEALQSRISKLPSKYTMSQLLDTWEYSVREMCSMDRILGLDSVMVN